MLMISLKTVIYDTRARRRQVVFEKKNVFVAHQDQRNVVNITHSLPDPQGSLVNQSERYSVILTQVSDDQAAT